MYHGEYLTLSTTRCFPQGKSHARLQRLAHFCGALPEQPANAKGSAGCIDTQRQGAAPRCCTSLASFHSPIPPSPTHISFVLPFLIPMFLCCLPRHPLLYSTACPSTLFSKFTSLPPFLWELPQSPRARIKMRKYQPWGPFPFTVSGAGSALVGDCTKRGGQHSCMH